jgi:hypothetical protein
MGGKPTNQAQHTSTNGGEPGALDNRAANPSHDASCFPKANVNLLIVGDCNNGEDTKASRIAHGSPMAFEILTIADAISPRCGGATEMDLLHLLKWKKLPSPIGDFWLEDMKRQNPSILLIYYDG